MSILLRTSVILSNPMPVMPETTSGTTTLIPKTLMAPVSPPKVKKRRRELTNAYTVDMAPQHIGRKWTTALMTIGLSSS